MGLFGKLFGKHDDVAYWTWHSGSGEDVCKKCKDLDGTCWVPGADFSPPPLKDCTRPGGCNARALVVKMDEAWGPGDAEFIKKKGGVATGKQMDRFHAG